MKIKILRLIKMASKFTIYGILIQTISLSVLLASNGIAQNKSVKEVYIEVESTYGSLDDVFEMIEAQTNYRFAYSKDNISNSSDLEIKSGERNVYDVLIEVSKKRKLKFTQINNSISVEKLKQKRRSDYGVVEIEMAINITGKVTSAEDSEGLPGVNVIVKGTTQGSVTDIEGNYSLEAPGNESILVFSSVGYVQAEEVVGNRTVIDMVLASDITALDEIIVVGYGTQKKSDVTGSIASLPKERLEMVPNLSLTQALQASVPGVLITQTGAGANPSSSIVIRGKNSITANNGPLVIVDGIPSSLESVNPNDVESVEVLKDASASAIYGARGANGVILITTKMGESGRPAQFSYSGYSSFQKLVNYPNIMDGGEFYDFKSIRDPAAITLTEQENFDSGDWTNWKDEALRNGFAHQHSLSVSGATDNVNYYVSAGFFDVQGLQVNDDYKRATTRVNLDVKITDWLKVGTRTQLAFADQSGEPVNMTDAFFRNPLGDVRDSDGNLTLFPISDYADSNPLGVTLYDDINKSYDVVTNNFIEIDFPFVSGLKYRLNTGVNFGQGDRKTYRPITTPAGFGKNGSSSTKASQSRSNTIENILSYNNTFGKHGISGTFLYSKQTSTSESTSLSASLFPNDLNKWNSIGQAEVVNPSYAISERTILSQMIRLNYSYDARFLLTLTARRDGYSGFGVNSKWGTFPSAAIGWNIHNEDFFPSKNFISQLKLRVSYGLNGNQAIDPYQTIARMRAENMVSLSNPIAGYYPSTLAQDNLGWESSKSLNVGIDFGFLNDRIQGDINVYRTITTDLLLERAISPIHGITSITQNIGETQNSGIELSLEANAMRTNDFNWNIFGNLSHFKNKINSLFGILDEEGNEIDDVGNKWFIGQPQGMNYDTKMIGIWQLDEAAEAAEYGQFPGFVKVEDINNDRVIDADDRQFIGNKNPTFIWGLNNSFSYKNLSLSIFIHGVNGHTKSNPLWRDHALAEVRLNTTIKDWWTPENPDAEWVVNDYEAEFQSGKRIAVYESASFVRVKDITLSYDLNNLIEKLSQFRVYFTGRNLFTSTDYLGMDPELSGQRDTPLQKEYVIGLNFGF